MDVSDGWMNLQGEELIEYLTQLSGLPREWLRTEISHLIIERSSEQGPMTMDHLRQTLSNYLDEIDQDMKRGFALEQEPPLQS